MERKLNIFLWGTLSLLIIIIIASISYKDIGNITLTQQTIINENSEIIPSKNTQFAQITQVNHDSITIDGNDEFANQTLVEGWSGNGTIINPYNIANYSISTTGEPGINISNTNVYFRIVNVTITGSTNNETSAFHFSNVTNSEIVNNTATNSECGFILDNSNYNTLIGNYATKCNTSFSLIHSNYNLLNNNTASNSTKGFYLNYSSFNNLTSNVARFNSLGYELLKYNNDNVLTNNIATDGIFGFSVVTSCKNIIINNNATNCDYGFSFFYHSDYNILMRNNASNNNIGFEFANCRYNNITTNVATNNLENGFYFQDNCRLNDIIANIAENNDRYGFYASNFHNNLFKDNTAKYNDNNGLKLSYSSNNFLKNNSLYYNDLNIFGHALVHFVQAEFSNNTINDLPIIYLKYKEDLSYDNSQIGQIILVDSTNITITNNHFVGDLIIAFCDNIEVQNNTISWSTFGFSFFYMKDSTIENNTAVNNANTGFYLFESENNIFKGNIASSNGDYGFYLFRSDSNTFNYNKITYNRLYGIYNQISEENHIYLNIFIANNQGDTQAYSNSPNIWYYGIHGNYWSDYNGSDSNDDGVGDSAYFLDGDAGESDIYPLMDINTENITLVTDNPNTKYIFGLTLIQLLMIATGLTMLMITAGLAIYQRRKLTKPIDKLKGNFSLEKLIELPKQYGSSPSFNGEKLCFYSNKTGSIEIFCLDMISKDITQITGDGQLGKTPNSIIKWTRDDQNILYIKDSVEGNEKTNIWKMNLITKQMIQLTNTPESSDKLGSVDPCNKRIVFFSDRNNKITQLYKMKLDGSDLEQLTTHKNHVSQWTDLYWSPDGKKIVYSANETDDPKNIDIWMLDFDTKEDKKIISLKDGSKDSVTCWSPDGSLIAIVSDYLGYHRVGIYFPDTKEIKWFGDTKNQSEEEYFGCLLPKYDKIIVKRDTGANQTLIAYDIITGEEESLNLPSGFQTCIKQIIENSKIVVGHIDSMYKLRGLLYDYNKAKYDEIIPAEYGEFNPETDFHHFYF